MRVSWAMCSAMSPMRSSDALIRSALTTMRRSRATGCWRARISIASSSRATDFSSMIDVGLDDLFGQGDVARAERPRGFVDGDRDEFGDLDQTSLDVLEGLMEDFAHCSTFRVPQQARAWRPGDCRHRRLTNGAARVNSNGPPRPASADTGGIGIRSPSTAGAMDTTQLALLALLLGAIIGGSVSIGDRRWRCARATAPHAETSSVIPDGVREVLHGMDDAAVVVDASSTVLAASAAAVPFHLAEGERSALRRAARRRPPGARRASRPSTATLRLRRGAPPAEPRLVVVRATRISPRLTLLVLRDITERERVEQMRRDFVANTSHELKTPVGAVSLLAEAIESAADDPDQVRNFAARLTAEAARLAQLTSRIMNLSRLQAADEFTDEREVAVDEIVASAVGGARDPGRLGRRRDRPRRRSRPVRARRRAGARARPSAT